jgi:FKBP-type peptidyl-prolyl cis-trans isomerase
MFALALALTLTSTSCGAAEPLQAKPIQLNTETEKTVYALGVLMAQNVLVFSFTESELEILKAGLTDGLLGREAKADLEVYGPKIRDLANERSQAAAQVEKKAGADFIAKAAAEPGAVKAPSGFVYKEITAGTGATPGPGDRVKVNYTGTLTDGKVFDSSAQRGKPAEFALNEVIACWSQGVQMMKVGGKARLVCPAELAYGDRGAAPDDIKPGATLVFEVELLEIASTAPATPPAP